MTTAPFTKIVCIGVASGFPTLDSGRTRDPVRTFCKIDFDGRKLSISGVEGPWRNGDCAGASGQIVMHEWSFDSYCDGWDDKLVAEFRAIWRRWHLNDMRAGCEHQRASWPESSTQVEVVTYKLTGSALREQYRLKEKVMEAIIKPREAWPSWESDTPGGHAVITETQRRMLSLPYQLKSAPDADSFESGYYEVEKRETKAIGHIHPSEHPRGLLCVPCEQCGYKYGSQWLHEDVPDEVLAWLRALPESEISCTWWR